jgi:hypothetical protein
MDSQVPHECPATREARFLFASGIYRKCSTLSVKFLLSMLESCDNRLD